MPIVSVIIPIFNAEPYLTRCLESILCQTHRDLQVILINDGSTDNSLAIAKHYAQTDSRIEVYSQPNAGQSAARNNGMRHASGEYLSFIDADDYIDPDFFETLFHACQSDIDVVQIGYRRVQAERVISEQVPCTFYQYTSPCMRLHRRDFITRHNLTFPEGMIYEDVLFSLDLWYARPNYKILHYTGYDYRLNPLSTTSTRNRNAEQTLYDAIRQRFAATHNWRLRLLTIYTYIRLKSHFYKS